MLKILDPKNEYACDYVFPKVISASWTKRFYSPGSFSIVLPGNAKGTQYLQKNKIILHEGYAGIIKYRNAANNRVEIRGYDLKGLCSQRMVVPPFVYMEVPTVESGYDRIRGTPEEVIRHYADKHMINTTDPARKIPDLSLAKKHEYPGELVWQAKFTNLAEELESICTYTQLGYEITFDEQEKAFVFDVLQGADRTGSDTHYGLVTFSEGYHNVSEIAYTEDALSEKNVCFVAGTGEEEQQFVYEAYNKNYSGIERCEGYTTASGDDADYADEVESKGLAYVDENKTKESVDAKANSKLVYKSDWYLGDYVTVVADCFGERMELKKQITEVTETFEHSSHVVTPVFGEKKQSTIKKIMQRS